MYQPRVIQGGGAAAPTAHAAPPLVLAPAQAPEAQAPDAALAEHVYLTRIELARELGVAGPTLSQLLKARGRLGLPAMKLGNKWMARRDLVREWMAEMTRRGADIQCGDGGVRIRFADGTEK